MSNLPAIWPDLSGNGNDAVRARSEQDTLKIFVFVRLACEELNRGEPSGRTVDNVIVLAKQYGGNYFDDIRDDEVESLLNCPLKVMFRIS